MDGTIFHYLDGALVSEPLGVGDFTEELDRDAKNRFISVKYASTLTFVLDGYEYLNDRFTEDGYCSDVQYEAYHECAGRRRLCARGVIKVADVKSNLTRCEAEASIADDGLGAMIVDNDEIPVAPLADKSKNGEDITPVTTFLLEVFDPQDNIAPADRSAWDWWDAIQHAVQYITDGQQALVSDWYDALPDDERYAITTGRELRTGADDEERITWDFKSLFMEMAIKYDLWLGVQRVNDLPVLRIEPQSYWFGSNTVITNTDIQDLVRSIDAGMLWAKVNVGSDIAERQYAGGLSLPFIPLRGHTKEEFHFSGVCNTKETLDLVNEWIIDTNTIEDIFVNGNDEHDEELVLIQYDRTTSKATKGYYLFPTPIDFPALYNERLLNINVLGRYDLPSPVGAYFNSQDAQFQAVRTIYNAPEFYNGPASTSALSIVRFDQDYAPGGFDTSNAWGNGTPQGNPVSQANSRYTSTGEGAFMIAFDVQWRITSAVPFIIGGPVPITLFKYIHLNVHLERYEVGNTLVSSTVFSATPQYLPGVFSFPIETTVVLNTGDYLQLRYTFSHDDFLQLPGPAVAGTPGVTVNVQEGYIQTQFVFGGGYVEAGGDARIVSYEYERHIDTAQWLTLTADPGGGIDSGGGPTANISGHALNVKRNVLTGKAEWKVISRP